MSSSLSPLLLPPLLSALSPICMFLMQSLHLISCEPATYSFPWGPCLCILWLLRFGALQVGQSAPYPHRPQCLHLKESRQVFLTSTRGTWMMSSVNGFLPSLYPLLKAQPWHGQDGDTQSRAGAGLMLVNREPRGPAACPDNQSDPQPSDRKWGPLLTGPNLPQDTYVSRFSSCSL